MTDWQLSRNPLGRLVFTGADGVAHEGVVAVRAFPIGAPDEGISLLSSEGHELIWLERLSALPEPARGLVGEALAQREFMPEIRRLLRVSGFATPSTWTVETDRGPTELVLKGEEDIRRLSSGTLLVADTHGVQFLIRNLYQMDRHTRRLLDRFL